MEMKKLLFEIETEDGVEIESMWGAVEGESIYRIDNIPFYAYGVSLGDVVRAEADADGFPRYVERLRESGHSTLRVFFADPSAMEESLAPFVALGCELEGSDTPGLIAVDVPPSTSWTPVEALAEELVSRVGAGWELGCLSSHHAQTRGAPAP